MVHSAAAPAGRDDNGTGGARPTLNVVKGGRDKSERAPKGFSSLVSWTHGRTLTAVHVVIAALFLLATLFGSLVLRTQMEQNSFEQSETRAHISQLTQDVEDDQTKLDKLQASLPDKAQQMGMVPQQGSNSIDLQGYQPPKDGQ